MMFNKVILGLACLFLYVAFASNNVFGQETGKGKGTKAVSHPSTPSPSYGPGKGPGVRDEGDYDVQSAVEELKMLTADANKKSQVNRNILVGTTLVNTALLLVISGLIGYGLKDKKDDEDNGKGSRKGKEKKGQDRSGGDSNPEED